MTTAQKILLLFLAAPFLLTSGCQKQIPKIAGATNQANDPVQSKNIIMPAKKVDLVAEKGGDRRPFFRAYLKFVQREDKSKPANVELPDDLTELKKKIKIKTEVGKSEVSPFYIYPLKRGNSGDSSTRGAPSAATHDVMLLFDVSGSMNWDAAGNKIKDNTT